MLLKSGVSPRRFAYFYEKNNRRKSVKIEKSAFGLSHLHTSGGEECIHFGKVASRLSRLAIFMENGRFASTVWGVPIKLDR